MTKHQLVALGFSSKSIKHRITKGRLHPVRRGIYAVGRRQLTVYGHWMAAVLSCGQEAVLSHENAGALWGILATGMGDIHVSVPVALFPRRPGIVVHRRARLAAEDVTQRWRIPVTTPTCTLIDIATHLNLSDLEAAINQADKLDLVRPEELRRALDEVTRRPGVGVLRETLDQHTFALTDSELERRFLPIARRAGLPPPRTGAYVNGFKVDFYWPGLRLVVEVDGLRYHRTPSQQAKDRIRDQTHVAAGLTPLRFTHAQVRFQPDHVQRTLSTTARRLRAQDVRYAQ